MEVHSGVRLQQKIVKRRSFKTVFVQCASGTSEVSPAAPALTSSRCASLAEHQDCQDFSAALMQCNSNKHSCTSKKCVGVFVGLIQTGRWKVGLMKYDELIPGCSLHHLNLSGIDISLLNNKASKQLLPVHSTRTANPLEVSNLRFKCCARVRGENARLDPRYHIWTPRGCQTKQATVLSDMSLGLCFGCFDWKFFCWCRGLVHLYLSREAAGKLEKIIWLAEDPSWGGSKLQTLLELYVSSHRCSRTAVSCLLCRGSRKPGLKFNKQQPVNWLKRSRCWKKCICVCVHI